MNMEFAIIAAGEGSRLAEEGLKDPKPLVKLNGLPLIHRLIDTFSSNGASRIHIIINDFSPAVETYLSSLNTETPLNIIKKSTPSSLHSFFELTKIIEGNSVCLTTVDTVFDETEFSGYIDAFQKEKDIDALMAVTSFVDDESPLYVATDSSMMVTAYLDGKSDDVTFVSGGIYCLRRNAFSIVEKAIAGGTSRMRNFQRMLISKGCAVKAYPFSKIIDIDHVHDIATAQQWLDEKKLMTV